MIMITKIVHNFYLHIQIEYASKEIVIYSIIGKITIFNIPFLENTYYKRKEIQAIYTTFEF